MPLLPGDVDQSLGPDRGDNPAERMRRALARMLAEGHGQQYTPEDLWIAQASRQWPPPPPPPDDRQIYRPTAPEDPTTTMPIPIVNAPDERFTRFPMQGEPKPGEGEAPFGGKGQVVGPAPRRSDYEPPKREKNKGKR